MDEYKKAIGQNEEGLSALITQYQIPDILPLAQDLPNETLLLTEKTTVTLSNIEISEKLFFVLLEKTKITIGERFSITKYVDSEDCIREHSMARETPFCLRDGAVSSLALENIERMAPNSIGCSLKDIKLYNTGLINILPKLRINEDCEFESLVVTASKEEHIAAILTQDKPFYVGRVKEMCLKNYAVSTLPKLRVHVIEFLKLVATEKEHVSTILAQDQKLCVGRVKEMKLEGYAVFVFLKMKETRENLESLVLSISKDELWRKMHGKIKKENIAICVEEVENLFLTEHAVNILPALKTKGEMDLFFLDADTEDQVSEVLAKEYKGISFGGIKDFGLLGSAVNLLPKIRLKEDCEVEIYSLIAPEERQVSIVLGKEDRSIATGRVKNMELTGYAVCVLPKLRIHNDNTMGSFRLSAGELYFSRIPGEGDSSIELGRIEQKGFDVPKEIRRKLRYTLVDGEGKEILEEERSSSQRGTLFD
ncbi:MAG: uncharacterized protein A8A55_2076 [Amphiamblys sp. WSBS2006]|nr:MAG: uncharacterized protein A8A55_2076 [Amphiamblys sp. WSBS2006]